MKRRRRRRKRRSTADTLSYGIAVHLRGGLGRDVRRGGGAEAAPLGARLHADEQHLAAGGGVTSSSEARA